MTTNPPTPLTDAVAMIFDLERETSKLRDKLAVAREALGVIKSKLNAYPILQNAEMKQSIREWADQALKDTQP